MRPLSLVTVLAVIFFVFQACKTETSSLSTKSATDSNGYAYEYVTNDPSNTRIYTLDNGLKVLFERIQE